MKKVLSKIQNINSPYKLLSIILIIILLALVPFVIQSNHMKGILTKILIFVLLSSSLNVINGYSGQFNLGHAAYYCIGAYTYAIISVKFGIGFWPMLIVSGVMAALLGFLVSLPTLKLKGMYLAMVTMGASEIVRLIALNWTGLTGGAMGIKDIPSPSLFGLKLNQTSHFYLIILGLVILMLFMTYRIMNSRTGRAWLSIREDQNAARFLGVKVNRQKSINFMYGAFWAGVAGCFAASFYQYISPGLFTLDKGFDMLLMVIVGGQGTLIGPIIGAVFVSVLTEILRFAIQYRFVVYAILIIIMMWYKPNGLISIINSIFDKFKKSKKEIPK